jgi:hypothetical protein
MDDAEKVLWQARDAHGKRLGQLKNVVGIGLGAKVVNGKGSPDRPCLRVYVTEKVPESELDPAEMVPSRVDDVETDVIQRVQDIALGTPTALGGEVTPYTSYERPITGGAQIARVGLGGAMQYPGTATCSVRILSQGQEVPVDYLLSAAHVLWPTLKDKSYKPGSNDVHQPYAGMPFAPGPTDIAYVGDNQDRWMLSGPGVAQTVDCGLARIKDGYQPSNYVMHTGQLDHPNNTGVSRITYSPTLDVQKYGRATGRSSGVVHGISEPGMLGSYSNPNIELIDLFEITPIDPPNKFCDEGDSGSPVVVPYSDPTDPKGGHATLVGILIGARSVNGTVMGIACKIENVFQALNISHLCGLAAPKFPPYVPPAHIA